MRYLFFILLLSAFQLPVNVYSQEEGDVPPEQTAPTEVNGKKVESVEPGMLDGLKKWFADFKAEKKEQLIKYLKEKYGKDEKMKAQFLNLFGINLYDGMTPDQIKAMEAQMQAEIDKEIQAEEKRKKLYKNKPFIGYAKPCKMVKTIGADEETKEKLLEEAEDRSNCTVNTIYGFIEPEWNYHIKPAKFKSKINLTIIDKNYCYNYARQGVYPNDTRSWHAVHLGQTGNLVKKWIVYDYHKADGYYKVGFSKYQDNRIYFTRAMWWDLTYTLRSTKAIDYAWVHEENFSKVEMLKDILLDKKIIKAIRLDMKFGIYDVANGNKLFDFWPRYNKEGREDTRRTINLEVRKHRVVDGKEWVEVRLTETQKWEDLQRKEMDERLREMGKDPDEVRRKEEEALRKANNGQLPRKPKRKPLPKDWNWMPVFDENDRLIFRFYQKGYENKKIKKT
jgi:hypothetical protein